MMQQLAKSLHKAWNWLLKAEERYKRAFVVRLRKQQKKLR